MLTSCQGLNACEASQGHSQLHMDGKTRVLTADEGVYRKNNRL